MRAWTLKQPYAQLVAAGVVDVRLSDVDTDYRGRVAIHAAAVPMTMAEKAEPLRNSGQANALFVQAAGVTVLTDLWRGTGVPF